MTRETTGEADARRYTCSIIGRPSISASGLPGKRVEANRAGMTATTSSAGVESTAGPVDAGCTTNSNTVARRSCYDPRRHYERAARNLVRRVGTRACDVGRIRIDLRWSRTCHHRRTVAAHGARTFLRAAAIRDRAAARAHRSDLHSIRFARSLSL